MAYVTIDDVAVPRGLWVRVLEGDVEASSVLRAQLQGIELYEHVLSCHADDVLVKLADLDRYGVIGAVRIA